MTAENEAKIRREGFPITIDDANHLLHFIKVVNPSHDMIESEIVIKLELLSRRYYITEAK